MMRIIKKNLKTLLTLVTTLAIINPYPVFAANVTVQTKPASGVEDDKLPTYYGDDSPHRYSCQAEPSYGFNRIISVNAYDIQGRSIIPYEYQSKMKFKSGTWIGINLREYRYATFNVDISNYKEIMKEYICTYTLDDEEEDEEYCVDKASDCPGSIDSEQESSCKTTHYGPEYPGGVWVQQQYYCIVSGGGTIPSDLPETTTKTTLVSYYATATTTDCPAADDYYTVSSIAASTDADGDQIETEVDATAEAAVSCAVTVVQDAVKKGYTFVNAKTLQFEMINGNDYNEKKLDVRIFDNNELMADRKANGSYKYYKDTKYGEEQIVSADKDHTHTKIPALTEKTETGEAMTINSYVDKITKENYKDYMERTYYTTYEYSPSKVCIDLKTGEVDYDTENNGTSSTGCTSKASNSNVKIIENGETEDTYLNSDPNEKVKYWHYFIPLDTPTSSYDTNNLGFFIKVANKYSEGLTAEECKSILELQPRSAEIEAKLNYTNFIFPVSPGGAAMEFAGDYYGTETTDSKDMDLFKGTNAHTCKFSTEIKFNIEQKFYGEEQNKNKTKIKGYGFYYRPIDINNPFPNKISSESIWKGIYDEKTKLVNVKNNKTPIKLSESFKTITYSTKELKLSKVREASKNYTSWENMKLDGTSKFIDELKVLRKNVDIKKLYRIGCGPDNLDWTGCKASTKEGETT